MQRRGGSEQPVKGQSANRPEARNAPTAQVSTADLQEQLDRRTRERDEAREQLTEALEYQTATGEVLNVISRSPTAVQPVFDMIAESAARLCEGQFCFVYRFDGQLLHFVAHHSLTPEVLEMNRRAYPAPPSRRSAAARAILERSFVQIPDINMDPDYLLGAQAVVGGYRSVVGVPILRDGLPIGSIAVARAPAGLLPDRQIELLKTFADQAAIAIENVRLFNETKEALEQQTATSEVLKVIASSPGGLQQVFDTMLQNATRLCGASYGAMWLRDADGFRNTALHGPLPPEYVEKISGILVHPGPDGALTNLMQTRKPVHVPDLRESRAYLNRDILPVAAVEVGGVRTIVSVPMFKGDEVIGAITIYRKEVRPFTEKQIELVENFAAQAVIAIENARLLNELRQRTDDLSEALEQQTATSEVLKVISSSPGELEPVFNAMLENATHICGAKFGILFQCDGNTFDPISLFGVPATLAEFLRKRGRFQPGAETVLDRILQTKDVVSAEETNTSPAVKYGGARSSIGVPMLKENKLVGAFFIYRTELRPFTDKQGELLSNFAAQAVIAIENTRLLSELRESLQQQTATADVLKTISSSPGQLEPVFNVMLENAVRVCGAKFGILYRSEGNGFRTVAMHDVPRAFAEKRGREPFFIPPVGSPLGHVTQTRQVAQTADVTREQDYAEGEQGYAEGHRALKDLAELGGARTVASVPMLKDDKLVGAITIYRQEVRPFTDKQIEIVKNFAAQAVIAIENTRLLNELRQRTNDLSELLEQQTATSEVLKVISSSPGDLAPVFDAILENATRICEAKFANLFLHENGQFRRVALHGAPRAWADYNKRQPIFIPTATNPIARLVSTKQPVHIADMAVERAYLEREPVVVAIVEEAGARTILGVPMLKEGKLIGAIAIYRQEVRPFTEKQISLMQNFASQAVIAIENTRLLNELRESLQQQTATADVLKVISSSPGELAPVFDSMLAKAAELCEASYGTMWLREGDGFRAAALHGALPPAFEQRSGSLFRPGPDTTLARIAQSRTPIQVADLSKSRGYLAGDPLAVAGVDVAGIRTLVSVPMLKESELIGVISVYRKEVRPFADKQIELVKNFAAQAVIAIENARLLSELRQRTDDLSESLEQQTATSEVLKVISSSPGELEPVFQAMLENATRICEARFGNLVLYENENDAFRMAAMHGAPPEFAEKRGREPIIHPSPKNPLFRVAKTRQLLHIIDLRIDEAYVDGDLPIRAFVELAGTRTIVVVPMLKDDKLIGAIGIYRQEVRPFTDKQIELLKNFAAQAVIAIENTRLLSELRESLQQQTATSEVLQVISGSAGELQPVFDTMLENAVRICGAKFGSLLLVEGDTYRNVALYGAPQAFLEERQRHPIISPRPGSDLDRVRTTKQIIHIADMQVEGAATAAIVELAGARTFLNVPMLKDDELIGVIGIYRQEVHPFTDKQIELVKNFAAQAVIAIENTRLLSELRESLQQQTATADVLKVISRSTFDLRTVLQTLVEFSGPAL